MLVTLWGLRVNHSIHTLKSLVIVKLSNELKFTMFGLLYSWPAKDMKVE